jgi:predicted helicase
MKKRGTRRMITFHSRVKQAKDFSKNVPIVREWLRKNRKRPVEVWGDAVSGEMPVVQREQVLARFDGLEDGECGIVSNARCLGEGVDVPTIDGISFVQPKRSAIDIVQAVGRAIRKSKKKEGKSTIILPVPILHKRNTKATIESSAFETVWRVLEALRAHDDVLAESLDTLRTKLGQRKGGRIRLPKLILDLPRSVNASFSDAIRLHALEHTTETFWESLGYLKAYKKEHGDCRVPKTFKTKDGYGLGLWVSNRRRDYKKGALSQERIDALDALGFIWDPKKK